MINQRGDLGSRDPTVQGINVSRIGVTRLDTG